MREKNKGREGDKNEKNEKVRGSVEKETSKERKGRGRNTERGELDRVRGRRRVKGDNEYKVI